MVTKNYYSLSEAAEVLGKSKETLRRWDREGKLNAIIEPVSNYRVYRKDDISSLIKPLLTEIDNNIDNTEILLKDYKVLELFAGAGAGAGAGGLAIGLEKSGIKCAALNEIDKWACNTLRENRPNWNVLEGDIKNFNFKEYQNTVDIVTGGFPCQAFSYAGKKLGLEDARGTLFYEFA